MPAENFPGHGKVLLMETSGNGLGVRGKVRELAEGENWQLKEQRGRKRNQQDGFRKSGGQNRERPPQPQISKHLLGESLGASDHIL